MPVVAKDMLQIMWSSLSNKAEIHKYVREMLLRWLSFCDRVRALPPFSAMHFHSHLLSAGRCCASLFEVTLSVCTLPSACLYRADVCDPCVPSMSDAVAWHCCCCHMKGFSICSCPLSPLHLFHYPGIFSSFTLSHIFDAALSAFGFILHIIRSLFFIFFISVGTFCSFLLSLPSLFFFCCHQFSLVLRLALSQSSSGRRMILTLGVIQL